MKARRFLWALLLLAACTSGGDGPRPATRLTEPGDAISEPLMLALAQAKNFHHKVEVYLKDGRVDEAITEVRRVLTIPFPTGAPEADDVRLDARAKLAKLLVMKGDATEAMRVIDEGLAASPRESFFLANLYTVQGEVHEAVAATLTEQDPAGARERLKQALISYDTSIQINERLQQRLLHEVLP